MKAFIAVTLAVMLTACGTVGGAMEGAGQDLGKAGNYVKKIGN